MGRCARNRCSRNSARCFAKHGKFGIVGSNHTTNEENYLAAEIARQIRRHQILITTEPVTLSPCSMPYMAVQIV